MRRVVVSLVLGALGVSSCGGNSTTSKGANGGSEAGGDDTPFCAEGCEAVLAADCPNGPDTQAACENDCERLATGSCAEEYRELQDCSIGKAVSCSASGIPAVVGCQAEQASFIDCLNP
jgi:hypothetical protein